MKLCEMLKILKNSPKNDKVSKDDVFLFSRELIELEKQFQNNSNIYGIIYVIYKFQLDTNNEVSVIRIIIDRLYYINLDKFINDIKTLKTAFVDILASESVGKINKLFKEYIDKLDYICQVIENYRSLKIYEKITGSEFQKEVFHIDDTETNELFNELFHNNRDKLYLIIKDIIKHKIKNAEIVFE